MSHRSNTVSFKKAPAASVSDHEKLSHSQSRHSATHSQKGSDRQSDKSLPRSPSGKSNSKKSLQSRSSKGSAVLLAKKAALQAEAAALKEKETIEQQMLQLQQRAKRLEIQVQLDKLDAEQQVLDNISEEDEEKDETEKASGLSSNSSEARRMQNDRIQKWINETAKHHFVDEYERPTSRHDQDESRAQKEPLNPCATEFHVQPSYRPVEGEPIGLEDMIHVLSIPKTEMMTFDGDPIKYWTFIKAFENSIGKHRIDEHAKLARLLQYCKGRAYKVIEPCAVMEAGGYARAKNLLHERFGDKFAISASWMNRVTSGFKITNDTLQDFGDELLSFRETLQALDCLSEVNQQMLLKIAERLPVYLQHRWRQQASKLRERGNRPGVDQLVDFVRTAAKEVSDPVFGDLGISKTGSKQADQTKNWNKQSGQQQPKKGFHGATAGTSSAADERSKNEHGKQCVVCHSSDCKSLFKCQAFKSLMPEKRFEIAKTNNLCFNCLKSGHSATKCRAESTCKAEGCKLKHSAFLHVARRTKADNQSVTSQKAEEVELTTSCGHVTTSSPRVALPVVRVNVTAENGSTAQTYALLDNGSTNTFCTSRLLQELQSTGSNASLDLKTLNGKRDCLKTSVHELEVSGVDSKNSVTVTRVYATERPIPVPRDCIVSLGEIENWDYLRELPITTPQEAEVEMLIGQDCPEILMPLEVKAPGEKHGPFAVRTLLGWTINGPLKEDRDTSASVHFVSASSTLEQQVQNFWKIEGALLADDGKGLSVEDRTAFSIMQSKTLRLEDDHYSVPIPFRENRHLPNNRDFAEKRLTSLVKRLDKNSLLKQEYIAGMGKLLEKGYAEEVDTDSQQANKGEEWYLPHHPVVSPNKNTKVRIVFDCAAKYQGVSLNDKVLQGPDLTNGLIGILLRFRQYPVAISGDVEAMFLQVKVPPQDRDVLRFLWYPEGDTSANVQTFRMSSHLFGGTWSPSICTYALQQTARDNSQDFKAEIVEAVLHDFYVDDLLKSVETECEAIQMITEIPKLLMKGGFRLCKWLSNKRRVIETVPDSERAKGLQDLGLQALPTERTLGVLWEVDRDVFTYAAKETHRPMTRRGMLGSVSSVYDPMGLVCPFTVRGRLMVQALTREGASWDEPLSEEHMKNWQDWLEETMDMQQIKVPRCLKPKDFGEIVKVELHHFSDASTVAYGAASYAKLVNNRGDVSCNLLFARSCVAPLKKVTIPRLELAAATMSVRQDQMIQKELSLSVDISFFWTDSTIVLSYIQNEKRRFHTYVANRLAVIHAGSSVEQWRHIKSEENPADDLSRGLRIADLADNRRWFHGPKFLSEVLIPDKNIPPTSIADDDPEVRKEKVVLACAPDTQEDIIDQLIHRHSSWTKLKRAVAWLLRYKGYLLAKARKQTLVRGEEKLSVQELNNAERSIIRFAQRQEYREEIRRLQTPAKAVLKNSRIYKLDPTLTDDGILICGSRNTQMFTSAVDAPAILPKNHHISTLLTRHFHEFYGHAGREFTGAKIRQRYWIQGLRTIVRRTVKECRECRRLFSSPMTQRMADLPKERLARDKPPFTNVGVDCFGPFVVKTGRKQLKRYGCIFTCLTSRAIHLETLDSMDTHSFINALQRFISRRGNPETICCDNGTNFVGAERELRASIQQWNQQRLDAFLSQREVQWKFNPPGASHMGGAWERLIRSVRRTLQSVMNEQVTSDDTLNTLMCIVENIVNSRPLTVVSDDPSELDPLTPNHLLLLKPTTLPPLGIFVPQDCYVRRRWRQVQYLADVFWRRWIREYLPLLQLRTKWRERRTNLKEGDIVLLVDNNVPRNRWQLGRVVDVFPSKDGLIRSAKIRTASSVLTRPITKLCFLEGGSQDDQQYTT